MSGVLMKRFDSARDAATKAGICFDSGNRVADGEEPEGFASWRRWSGDDGGLIADRSGFDAAHPLAAAAWPELNVKSRSSRKLEVDMKRSSGCGSPDAGLRRRISP